MCQTKCINGPLIENLENRHAWFIFNQLKWKYGYFTINGFIVIF